MKIVKRDCAVLLDFDSWSFGSPLLISLFVVCYLKMCTQLCMLFFKFCLEINIFKYVFSFCFCFLFNYLNVPMIENFFIYYYYLWLLLVFFYILLLKLYLKRNQKYSNFGSIFCLFILGCGGWWQVYSDLIL